MRGTLKLTVIKGDLEFLKYLINNQNVDVNGEHEFKHTHVQAYSLTHTCYIHKHAHSN